MNLILLVGAALLAAFVVHVTLWRWRAPRRAMRGLMAIFVLGLLGTVAFGATIWPRLGFGDTLYAVTLYTAISICYMLLYTAIEADSPTLSLVHFIGEGGMAGRTRPEIETFFQMRPFVRSRLGELFAGGFVVRRGERLELTGRSGLVIEVGEYYRGVMRRQTRGG